jgi:signal peptidase
MMKKVAKWLGSGILILVILLAVFVLIAPRFGWHIGAVLSGSMEPTLSVGGAAVTRPVNPEDIKVGDIITYRSPEEGSRVISHRVIEVVGQGSELSFRTKGDANEEPDAYIVPAQSVTGRVVFDVPLAGYFVDFVKSPLGAILLLVLPGVIVIGMEARNIWRTLSEREQAKRSAKMQ